MTPRQFLDTYGPVVVYSAIVQPGVPFLIPPDPDRYYINIYYTSNNVTFVPDSNNPDDLQIIGIGLASSLYEKTHALHGAAVNLGLAINTTAPNTQVLYMIGRMQEPGSNHPEVTYGGERSDAKR